MEEKELHKYIIYINDNINELKTDYRVEILQMILYSNIEDAKIVEKGNGSSIKFSDLESGLIKNIYNFIKTKIDYNFEI
ncbi:MAG: hypothetical protein ACRCZI_04710 [Cetobacterium sp.]